MRYFEIQPRPPLSKYVECFWFLEGRPGQSATPPERILPDGCVELILNFAAPFCEQKGSGGAERQPLRFLVGQITRPLLIVPTGRVHLLGIRFHPGGSRPFFPVPMQELTNQIVELESLAPRLERELFGRTADANSIRTKIAIAEKVLLRQIGGAGKRSSSLQGAVTRILSTAGQVSVDALAADAGISGRQLERRFLKEVGVGPKMLCRILRFQRVFRAVENNDAGWAAVAADCGYFDQSHLIRDFQQFAGETPSVLFASVSPLTENFTRKHRASDFYNTLA